MLDGHFVLIREAADPRIVTAVTHCSQLNTRQYRAPEVMLGAGWSFPADLWSVGCIVVELYQGNFLFNTHENMEHFALIDKAAGPFPPTLLARANPSILEKYFNLHLEAPSCDLHISRPDQKFESTAQ